MSRTNGAFISNSNYEVQIRKPFDARTVVTNYNDLINRSTWLRADGAGIIAYNGMPVAVVNTTDVTNNGLYLLFDPACTSALKSPDVTDTANWLKIGESSDISDYAERITQLEADVADIQERLTAVENAATETYGYRSGFPSTGIAGKLYVAIDTAKTYVWVNNKYLCVGDDTESYEIISGGNAASEN